MTKDYSIGLTAVQKAKMRQHKLAKEAEQYHLKKTRAMAENSLSNASLELLKAKADQAIRDCKLATIQYADTIKQMR